MDTFSGWERRRTHWVGGLGKMVFPDATSVSVQCVLELFQEFQDGIPFSSEIVGRVWKRGDKFFARKYLAKHCVLEIKGHRLSMFITDAEGHIGHFAGIVEGFPGLRSELES
jgi:hypothetical protein